MSRRCAARSPQESCGGTLTAAIDATSASAAAGSSVLSSARFKVPSPASEMVSVPSERGPTGVLRAVDKIPKASMAKHGRRLQAPTTATALRRHLFASLSRVACGAVSLRRLVRPSSLSRRRTFAMLDLEVQKLIQDGKIRCWLDIDINDTRASYQRAVDFVGAKNLACKPAIVLNAACISHFLLRYSFFRPSFVTLSLSLSQTT